ncbi:hypothetical protein BDZ91DRAFT_725740 [Kalaharituber pfeilii]|nr:hypothetical protein BDZ91DRAFT_725740 [Kalaharituber pfeilii]
MSFVQRGLYTLQFPHVTPVPDWQVCGEGTLRMWLEYPTLAEQGSRGAAFAFMAPAVMERAKKLVAEGLGEEKWERLCREWEWLQE